MARLFLIFITYLTGLNSFAQSTLPKNTSDSLWTIWKDETLSDQQRVKALMTFTSKGYLRSNPDSAYYYYTLAYEMANEANLEREKAVILNSQGIALNSLGNYYSAIDHYKRSLTILQNLGLEKESAVLQSNISYLYRNLGEYSKALEFGFISLTTHKKNNNSVGIINALNAIGLVYQTLGDYAKAMEYYDQSLQLAEISEHKEGTYANLNNMANVFFYLGEYSRALEFHERSIKLKQENGDKVGMALSINNLGVIVKRQAQESIDLKNYDLGKRQHKQALGYFFQSLLVMEEVKNHQHITSAFQNIGNLYTAMGNAEISEGNFNSGFVLFDSAHHYLNKALEIGREMNFTKLTSGLLINKGYLYRSSKNLSHAYKCYSEAFALADSLNTPEEMRESTQGLFLVNIQMDSISKANYLIDQLIDLRKKELITNYASLTEVEKEKYFLEIQEDFYLQYDFALKFREHKNQAENSYNNAILTKGLMLRSSTAMRQTILNSDDSLLIDQYYKWVGLQNQMIKMSSNGESIDALEEKLRNLEKDLVKKSGAFEEMKKAQQMTWRDVQVQLKPDEAAIEFIHFRSEIDTTHPTIYAALIVKSDSKYPEFIELCTESDLKNILGIIQGNNLSFIEKVYGKKNEAKLDLYEKIWQPLEPYLKDIKTIYYSPSGLLYKVSFDAISKDANVFLTDLYNFQQLGSTGNLAFNSKINFGELDNFLLMGGVNYNSDSTVKKSWEYLPGSLAETNVINSFLIKKKFGVNYFNGSNATEEIFKEKIGSSSIVHIATHGFFFPDPDQIKKAITVESENQNNIEFRSTSNYANWSFVNNKNPLMRSGIVLAHSNDIWTRNPLDVREDGIITAQEVSGLHLPNTKLVVLSACETGLGDIRGSEGVFGLQRAFKIAGVKYLIMSLWQVPDNETAEFMILFYKNLIKLKDIPSAFQKTQKVMRDKYDPYYWGAFVLIE